MSQQTRLDTDHLLVLLIGEVAHGLGFFDVWIPNHTAHRHWTFINFSHGLHLHRLAFAFAAATDANLDAKRRVLLFGMYVHAIHLTGSQIDIFIVRSDLAIIGRVDLVNHRISAKTVDVALRRILSGISVNGEVCVLKAVEVEGIRAGILHNENVGEAGAINLDVKRETAIGAIFLGVVDRPRVVFTSTGRRICKIQCEGNTGMFGGIMLASLLDSPHVLAGKAVLRHGTAGISRRSEDGKDLWNASTDCFGTVEFGG
mmetsp:Transcript_12318/g.20512  ORF Transcript_12318/g.20512 Transcript_12318/m.20512 type:complete len:258 (+) Transcript_12318:207-980(+)